MECGIIVSHLGCFYLHGWNTFVKWQKAPKLVLQHVVKNVALLALFMLGRFFCLLNEKWMKLFSVFTEERAEIRHVGFSTVCLSIQWCHS